MNKQYNNIDHGYIARKHLSNGINKLADAVKVTLGAGGRNVVIQREDKEPLITKDGVTVANSINIKDPKERLGANLVKSVASKTAKEVGDGTSTATVLTQAILNQGLEHISRGSNAVSIKRGIDSTVKKIVENLETKSQEIESDEQICRIARISANGDKHIAELIKDSINKVGRSGYVSIDDSNTMDTYLEFVEGTQFDKGYLSPYFITNEKEYSVEYDNCLILFFGGKIGQMNKSLVNVLEIAADKDKPILIIADSIEGQALAGLVMNKLKGVVRCVAVKAPAFGDRRKEIMKDMCALTGGNYITSETGRTLDNVTFEDLGKAKKVKIYRDATAIIDGISKEEEMTKRLDTLEGQMKDTQISDYEREKIVERYSNLTNGVAVIKVGGSSEVEIQEKKDRIEDALYATKAAIDEGYTVGGGSALLHISNEMLENTEEWINFKNEDEAKGYAIVKSAILKPFEQILINAGFEPDFISKIKYDIPSMNMPYGFDVRSGKVVDMFEAGIIDPIKVIRLALQNAASVSSLMLTTEGMITIDEEEKDNIQYVPVPQQGM